MYSCTLYLCVHRLRSRHAPSTVRRGARPRPGPRLAPAALGCEHGRHVMIALVTGGTAGIGREIAAKLREAGLTVLITGRDEQRGAAVAAEIGAAFLVAEHTTIDGNLELARRLRERTASLDVLVNNVGGGAFPDRTLTSEGH